MSKKVSKVRVWIYRILMIAAAVVFVYSAIQLYDIYSEEKIVKDEEKIVEELIVDEEQGVKIDWAELQAKNPEIVGFIIVPDTKVFYPIVYRKNDNSYYLNHTVFNESHYGGAPFLDGRMGGDLNSDPHNVIYGHNILNSDIMFSQLDKYFDPTFFTEHPYIYIFTPTQNYRAEVISAYATNVYSDDVYKYLYTTQGQVDAYIDSIRSKSVVQTDTVYPEGTRYLTLSTCSFTGPGGFDGKDENRNLVHAALIPWDGEYIVPKE